MKPLIASHTFLDCFESCPKRAYHRYVAKDLPFVETEQMKWGNRVHSALEKRVGDGSPLPEDMASFEPLAAAVAQHKSAEKAVLCEEQMGMTTRGAWCRFFDPQVWLRGKLDVLIASKTSVFILDWKTGKRRENPAELETFAVLVRASFPKIETIKGAYVWLKEGCVGEIHDLNDTERKRAEITLTMDQAQELLRRGDPWPAHENGLCKDYCEVFSCQFNGRKR